MSGRSLRSCLRECRDSKKKNRRSMEQTTDETHGGCGPPEKSEEQDEDSLAQGDRRRKACERKEHESGVEVIGSAKPFFEVGIDLVGSGEFDAMGDAIFFGEAAGVDEALGEFAFVGGETETEVDARVGGGFDLREDVIAVERNHGFAGTSFDIGREGFAEAE